MHRILRLITRAHHGGAQQNTLNHLKLLRDRFSMILAAGEEGFLTESARSLGVEVRILPHLARSINPLRDLASLNEALRVFTEVRPDIVHCHSTKAGVIGRLASFVLGIPAVFTAHGWAFAEGISAPARRFAEVTERIGARLTKKIIAVCQADKELAVRLRIAPAGKIAVIPNGITRQAAAADPGRPGPPRIIMVARFAPQKDQDLLVRAVGRMSRPLNLVFVGEGPRMDRVRSLAAEVARHQNIEFLGDRGDVDQLLSQSHVFALATHWEGMPLSILEAMRAGLPVVATNVAGIGEQVVDGETGYLVPASDPQAFQQALERLLDDPGRRARMGRAGRERFEGRFTAERAVDQTASVYEEILG